MTESRRELLVKHLNHPSLTFGYTENYENVRLNEVDQWISKYPDEYAENKQDTVGWFQFCPICKVDRQTTCCACGCGNCCYCGYRFRCGSPLEFSVIEPLNIKGIEKNAVNRPLKPGDSCGLLFEEGIEEKIRKMLDSYEYVIVRKKDGSREPSCNDH